ncbi:sulfotransferase [Sulfitobacter sp. HNIBRBA2951]|uniref:sulfotransferase n=1 Tax=Sulfitobacter aquimarinus TaxID=3158557 RepID=UPI0032DFC02E
MTENKDGQDFMHPIHLCIGAPRAGTTWLFREMRQHPALFVPLVKEVRFWNSRRTQQHRDHAANDARKQIEDSHDSADQARWLEDWSKINLHDPVTMETYINLMSVEGRPSLDITPAYCFLPPENIRLLRKGLPEGSKVLYLMRDPLPRLYSQIKLHFSLHGMYRGRPSHDDLAEFLERPLQRQRWDYADVINTWRAEFGDDFIALPFEDVIKDPKALTSRVAQLLGFDLAPQTETRAPDDFFHSDKNQNDQIWTSSLTPKEKIQIAKAIVPEITKFADQMPDPGKAWLDNVHKQAAAKINHPDVVKDVDLPTQKLMRMTESLGDNCEYGFWQRHRGYEPSSLFRWAITPIDSLLSMFETPNRPLYLQRDLDVHSPGMVHDKWFGFKFHSKLVERDEEGNLRLLSDKAAFDEIYQAEAAKVAHLKAKFMAQMRRQVAVYIIKDNKTLQEDKVRKVLAELHARHPDHHLLWVEADMKPDGPPSTLTALGGGLLRGSVHGFAPYAAADSYVEGGWTSLMTQLSQHEPIAKQIAQMQH